MDAPSRVPRPGPGRVLFTCVRRRPPAPRFGGTRLAVNHISVARDARVMAWSYTSRLIEKSLHLGLRLVHNSNDVMQRAIVGVCKRANAQKQRGRFFVPALRGLLTHLVWGISGEANVDTEPELVWRSEFVKRDLECAPGRGSTPHRTAPRRVHARRARAQWGWARGGRKGRAEGRRGAPRGVNLDMYIRKVQAESEYYAR